MTGLWIQSGIFNLESWQGNSMYLLTPRVPPPTPECTHPRGGHPCIYTWETRGGGVELPFYLEVYEENLKWTSIYEEKLKYGSNAEYGSFKVSLSIIWSRTEEPFAKIFTLGQLPNHVWENRKQCQIFKRKCKYKWLFLSWIWILWRTKHTFLPSCLLHIWSSAREKNSELLNSFKKTRS